MSTEDSTWKGYVILKESGCPKGIKRKFPIRLRLITSTILAKVSLLRKSVTISLLIQTHTIAFSS